MTFIDLNKRRASRQALRTAASQPAGAAEWPPALLQALVELVPRGEDVLLLGLGPWGEREGRGLAEALLGRARSVVAIDPDPERLKRSRGYCERVLAAELAGLAEPELQRRIGLARFGAVILTDALVSLLEPGQALSAAKGFLLPSGRLYAVVPNALHADSRLALLAGELPKGLATDSFQHLYTRDRLRERLAVAGLGLAQLAPFERAPLGPQSGLVPALFGPEVLVALGPADDARAAYYLAQATPRPTDELLRELFEEQATLRRAVRNELAVVGRANAELSEALAACEHHLAASRDSGEQLAREAALLRERGGRLEQTVQRLGNEADQAQRELERLRASFWHTLGDLLRRLSGRQALSRPGRDASWHRDAFEPAPWKHEREQPRYEPERRRPFF